MPLYGAGGGGSIATNNYGTPANAATVTVDPSLGDKGKITNNVAGFTIAAPASDGGQDIMVTNGATAGTISFSGFTKALAGDALTTTVGHKFLISVGRVDGVSFYQIVAMQ